MINTNAVELFGDIAKDAKTKFIISGVADENEPPNIIILNIYSLNDIYITEKEASTVSEILNRDRKSKRKTELYLKSIFEFAVKPSWTCKFRLVTYAELLRYIKSNKRIINLTNASLESIINILDKETALKLMEEK